jgi:hypothetical protein
MKKKKKKENFWILFTIPNPKKKGEFASIQGR